MRIGYYDNYVSIPTTNAVKRSIKETVDKLEEAGHTMVKIDLSENFQWGISDLYFSFLGAFSFTSAPKIYEKYNENPHPFYKPFLMIAKSKGFRRRMLLFATWILGMIRSHRALTKFRKWNMEEIHELVLRRESLK